MIDPEIQKELDKIKFDIKKNEHAAFDTSPVTHPMTTTNFFQQGAIPLTTILPTYAPNYNQEVIYQNGTIYSYYVYVNGGWRSQQLGGGAAGLNTQVQFNDNGVFGGDAGLTYTKGSDELNVGNINVGADPNNPALSAGSGTLSLDTAQLGTSALLATNLLTTSRSFEFPDKSGTLSVGVSATFGGTGSDGALSISSGTTTIDCSNAQLVVKNYTSISITGTGVLAFSNPASLGTTVILKSQGGVTLTSSATPMVAMNSMGAAGGAGGTIGGTGNGSGGAGGASQGTDGSAGDNQVNGGGNGTTGSSGVGLGKNTGGVGGISNTSAAGGTSAGYPSTFGSNFRATLLVPGSGGGGGAGGKDSAGAAGGLGGGALYIECAGAFNFTTTAGISISGGNGSSTSAGGNKGGNGGGGGAGTCLILYGTLTANTGTVTVTGGAAGTGPAGGAGGAGANGYSIITANVYYS